MSVTDRITKNLLLICSIDLKLKRDETMMDLLSHLAGVESVIGSTPSATCKGPAGRWMDGSMEGWMD